MEISEVNPDGNVYQLKDSTARAGIAQIQAQNVYSTTETDTGKKWIDGKPIYRKVYSGTYTVSEQGLCVLVPMASLGYVETMIYIQGYHRTTSNAVSFISNFNAALSFGGTGAEAGIRLHSTVARSNIQITIWYEYTKV